MAISLSAGVWTDTWEISLILLRCIASCKHSATRTGMLHRVATTSLLQQTFLHSALLPASPATHILIHKTLQHGHSSSQQVLRLCSEHCRQHC